MRFMSTLIEIMFYDVTLVSHFVFTLDKASSEKILLIAVLSFPEIPPCYFEIGKALMRGISKMKTNEFSGYLRKLKSLSIFAVPKSFKRFS